MFMGFLLSGVVRLINAQSREKHGDRRVFLCFDLLQMTRTICSHSRMCFSSMALLS